MLDVSEAQDQPRVYINPEILESAGSETCEEGCLSVPGIYAEVSRAENIRVKAQNADNYLKTAPEQLILDCIFSREAACSLNFLYP